MPQYKRATLLNVLFAHLQELPVTFMIKAKPLQSLSGEFQPLLSSPPQLYPTLHCDHSEHICAVSWLALLPPPKMPRHSSAGEALFPVEDLPS